VNSTKQKRILIVRSDRVGDVVLSTPIPRELKKVFPDCFTAVLLREYTKDIYLNNPNVNQILVDLGKKDFISISKINSIVQIHSRFHAVTN
jgi:heptosyltransferase-2